MNKVYHYWLSGHVIRKEVYDVVKTDRYQIKLTRNLGTRTCINYISCITLNKWFNNNLWLDCECDDKVIEYYKEYLNQSLEKATKTVESLKQRIENYTGEIVS